MGEAYFNLKLKLEQLGYQNHLPLDAVPLVECILADLIQTTRSLQHYMDLSKDALIQRDSLTLEAEPYRVENAKLLQENNQLHQELMKLKEDAQRISKEHKRKVKSLTEEIMRRDSQITRLQHDIRDLSLRGLCADTASFRNKRKDAGDMQNSKHCLCPDKANTNADKEITELKQHIQSLKEKIDEYSDEITLLRNKVVHRDNEIARLNIQFEGGKPITTTYIPSKCKNDPHYQDLLKQLRDAHNLNEELRKEVDKGLEKQHEAMLRALNLADKNKALQEELQKVDTLALKVEEDCNKKLSEMKNEINKLQNKNENLIARNSELENEVRQMIKGESPRYLKILESLNIALKEKEGLEKEIKDLIELNKSLQDKVVLSSRKSLISTSPTPTLKKTQESLNSVTKEKEELEKEVKKLEEVKKSLQDERRVTNEENKSSAKCPTKSEMRIFFERERKNYEKHISDIQEKLNKTMEMFNMHMQSCKRRETSPKGFRNSNENSFIKDLHNKLCEKEQKILMLKKENDELNSKLLSVNENSKQNHKDIIKQLNDENSELSKENILLSQQLSQLRASGKQKEKHTHSNKDMDKLKDEIDKLKQEIIVLNRDKHEYNCRYKEAMEIADRLKRDLAFKQREMEQLQEENCSYKMSNRTGQASTGHLKDECNFLREQLKRLQSEVIKEKTLASQLKNIQLETERSSSEIQSELLSAQRQLNLSKDKIESLEKKCKDLQTEIIALQSDKTNLIDNIKKIDLERDKLVIELDHKAEKISMLEQKVSSQTFDINKLESELSDLKRKLSMNKVTEHKLSDSESQIAFLNGEISRLTQQYESAVTENKHLQNSLADANGNLKLIRIECEKSKKEVDSVKQQLQHYVAEVRRIEELLSQKEAERSDMLEHFASLSVEANILENTNHSLESESASKSAQMQSYVAKIQSLESKLMDKESIIDNQSTRIATMTCKISSLENEIKLMSEEKTILEQNISYLKQMCNSLQSENSDMHKGYGDTTTEVKLYENKIKNLLSAKSKLESENDELKQKLNTTERLLANSRKEVVELKLALQDATADTRSLQDRINRLRRSETEINETTITKEELELPLMLEETIHEISHEEDEDSSRFHEIHKRYSKYAHGNTL